MAFLVRSKSVRHCLVVLGLLLCSGAAVYNLLELFFYGALSTAMSRYEMHRLYLLMSA